MKKNWFVASNRTRIWWILTWTLRILISSTLIGSFCVKCITFDLKKYREVIFHDTEEWCRFEKKLNCGLENDVRNLAKFHHSTRKSQSWNFAWILLSKAEMYELKIYRGVMCHDKETWCKIWRGIDLSFQNWHKEFDEFWLE